MMGIIANVIVNFDTVKTLHKVQDHIKVYYKDATYDEIVFNSEPEAQQAYVQLAHKLDCQWEIEGGEFDESV